MIRNWAVAGLLLVFALGARADVMLEDFGGGCGPAIDNASAMNGYRAHINANGPDRLMLKPCQYYFASAPQAFDQVAPIIMGLSRSTSQLVRTFTTGNLIRVTGGVGTNIKSVGLRAGPGSAGSTGDMLRIDATASSTAGSIEIEDVVINVACNADSTVCGTIWRALFIDGFPKTTGAIGVRETDIKNLMVFSTTSGESVRFQGVVDLGWNGGAIIGPGDLLLVGNAAVPASYVNIDITHTQSSNLLLTRCIYCRFSASLWNGNVNNDSNTIYARVNGQVTGTVAPNWQLSGVSP